MIVLQPLSKADFPRIYAEMEQNFIPEERRDYEAARALLDHPAYGILEAWEGETSVGFITVWALEGFTFAEHFVVFAPYRNRGLGKAIMEALQKKCGRLVLEAEPPSTPIAARRQGFYRRLGFYCHEEPYLQPSYRGEGGEVPLQLFSYPAPLEDFDGTVQAIYQTVYGSDYKKP